MKKSRILSFALSLVMVLSLCGGAFAAHLTDEVTELETANSRPPYIWQLRVCAP
jgi:ABC-type glycerol-3-phosphate transport system substrate-binding protein